MSITIIETARGERRNHPVCIKSLLQEIHAAATTACNLFAATLYLNVMITRRTLHNILWVDIESPTAKEIRDVMDEFHLHPLVAEQLLTPTAKPRVDRYGNLIYLILHFPALKHTHSVEKNMEVDFIIGRNFLLTARYESIESLHALAKILDVENILAKNQQATELHAGHLFYVMIQKLYRAVVDELEYLGDQLDSVEERIFQGNEKEMVVELSKVSRSLLDFKQALASHRDMLESFKESSPALFDKEFNPYAKSILDEYFRAANALRHNANILTELRETNNSLVSTKQNEVMKIFTIMAFVTFPLSLIAAVFGMNLAHMPIVGGPNDFWIIVCIMLGLACSFFAFFKFKRWL